MQITNLLRTEFACCSFEELEELLKKYTVKSDINYIILKKKNEISAIYKLADILVLYYRYKESHFFNAKILETAALNYECLQNISDTESIKNYDVDVIIVLDRNGEVVGVIDNLAANKIIISSFSKETPKFSEMGSRGSRYYQCMVDNLGEEIFVADGDGNVIFVNPASEEMLELPLHQIIGRNVRNLEQEGFLTPSSTLAAIQAGKKVDIIQQVKNGRRLLATAVPIFDDNGKIQMVISTSKDLDYLNNLLEKVERQDIKLNMQNEEIKALRNEIFVKEGFISSSESMNTVKDMIYKVAPLDMNVLVYGETGVGKEVAVKAIHRFSNRKNKPFIKINCGIIPPSLIESELFGYEEGAFTGANKGGKMGKLEIADGGTLFLDEIGELPLDMQVKLLEFLQDKTITRVGGGKKKDIDVRIVAATNRDLEKMCSEGLFRPDLYYRLNVFCIHIPALRERREDIDAISNYYLFQYNNKYRGGKRFSKSLKRAFEFYSWPGNIRELEHVIESLYVSVEGTLLTAEDFQEQIGKNKAGSKLPKVSCPEMIPLKEAKWEVERILVEKAYRQSGSSYKAAKLLNVDQSTIVKLLKKHDLK